MKIFHGSKIATHIGWAITKTIGPIKSISAHNSIENACKKLEFPSFYNISTGVIQSVNNMYWWKLINNFFYITIRTEIVLHIYNFVTVEHRILLKDLTIRLLSLIPATELKWFEAL